MIDLNTRQITERDKWTDGRTYSKADISVTILVKTPSKQNISNERAVSNITNNTKPILHKIHSWQSRGTYGRTGGLTGVRIVKLTFRERFY